MKRLVCVAVCCLVGSVAAPLAQDKKETSQRPCVFTILVPAAAQVEIEGYPTKSRGEIRLFESPPMPPGRTYVYTVRAIFGGIVVTRTLEVSPDKPAELDLRPDFGIPVPAAKPTTPPKVLDEKTPKPKEPSKKPETSPAPSSFALSGVRDLILPMGGTTTLRLSVERKNLDGIIHLQLAGLPKGVSVSQLTIPAGARALDLLVRASPDTPPGKYSVRLQASAAGIQQEVKFSITVVEEIGVKPILPANPKPSSPATPQDQPPKKAPLSGSGAGPRHVHPFGFLSVSVPEFVSLAPGQTAKVSLTVERQSFSGPVHLTWLQVPANVHAPSATLKETENSTFLTVTAASDAAPITYNGRLQVAAVGGAIRLEIPIRIEIR